MAALRHTCPVKISLTLPAGVVLPVKSLNFISNNDVWGRVVHSVVIIVAWVACITVLIKNPDQKTFLAWPVHLYTNCLQLLVSAGPPKCLGHLPPSLSHSSQHCNNTMFNIEWTFEHARSHSTTHKLNRNYIRKVDWWLALILAPSGGVGVNYWELDQSESSITSDDLRARPMRMLY